jgi:uncharacterized protein
VLWSNGISFAGVLAFIFADLIVLPIIAAYVKYYGVSFALRITAMMFAVMVVAALTIDGFFSLFNLIPTDRPSTDDVFGSIELDYTLVLNAIATVVFATLIYLTIRRGVNDPVCGMRVDRANALQAQHAGRTYYFCSEHCRAQFLEQPDAYTGAKPREPVAHPAQL